MNNLERKIDLLIGVIQDLSEKVNGYGGMKPPIHRWVSSAELAVLFGCSQRTILNLHHENKFPEGSVQTRKRGKYNVHRFDTEKILPHTEKYGGKSSKIV